MGHRDNEISRRTFLDRTAKTGLAIYSVGPLAVAAEAQSPQASGPPPPNRYIDTVLCVGCRLCVPLCPMGAISMATKPAVIDSDECVECGTCTRSKICPVTAIKEVKLTGPRFWRAAFSNNPDYPYPTTPTSKWITGGRGTEETKTNDFTNRFDRDHIGVLLELGRPVLGARLSDLERVLRKFAAHGYVMNEENPVMMLLENHATGVLKPEVRNEKVISCIAEFTLPNSAANDLLVMVKELNEEVESVFSVSVALRADEAGRTRFDGLFGPNLWHFPNGKVNLGMAQTIAIKKGAVA